MSAQSSPRIPLATPHLPTGAACIAAAAFLHSKHSLSVHAGVSKIYTLYHSFQRGEWMVPYNKREAPYSHSADEAGLLHHHTRSSLFLTLGTLHILVMKASVAAACAGLVAGAAGMVVYYQPNGVFVPLSLSLPPQSVVQQQGLWSAAPQAATADSSVSGTQPKPQQQPTSLGSRIAGWLGLGTRNSQRTRPELRDSTSANTASAISSAIVDLATPIRKSMLNMLTALQKQLAKADPKAIANVLRGPMNDLKSYLKASWPTPPAPSPAGPAPLASAPTGSPQPHASRAVPR
ncbi:hypothetical protein GQ54DRAFT_301232 [Martensiomyces pterosporus]|nr:hypothetical protein GQ54DRAFT_301232 [Martensiomyces pterosporus]